MKNHYSALKECLSPAAAPPCHFTLVPQNKMAPHRSSVKVVFAGVTGRGLHLFTVTGCISPENFHALLEKQKGKGKKGY